MSNEHEKDEDVCKIFRKQKVITIKQLAKLLNCGKRTVQRRLIQWQTYTSYNHNGRYYVLQSIPEFDENGLWGYKGIFFSRNGNLRQTIVTLVNNSPAGLSVAEVSNLVKVSLNSFMAHDRNFQQLRREKIAGLFIYFSSDESTNTKQKEKRLEDDSRLKLTRLPTNAQAVIILVERINHPELNIEQLSVKLNKKGHKIKTEVIRTLFEHHDLLKKTVGISR